MFNKEKFHNQLALSIGYKLIHDKRFILEVEDSEDPWVTLRIYGQDDIRFRASCEVTDAVIDAMPETQNEIITIIDAVHQAYLRSASDLF